MSEVHADDVHARLRADSVEWKALSLVGFQRCDTRDPEDVVELRNCTCGSTIGRRRRITMADEIKITEEAADAADVVPASAPTETVSTEIKDPARGSRPRFASIATVKLDPNNLKPTWPIVIASLEQMSDWAVFAFRLGTLTLIQNCVRQLAEPDANADLVVQLRTLTEALAHMPLEA